MKKRRLQPIGFLPSLLTLGNGFCGFLAIAKIGDALMLLPGASGELSAATIAAFEAKITAAAWLIFLGMVFDALDGSVARMVNKTTDFGGQLDSLCDVVTFGIAPAFLVKALLEHQTIVQGLGTRHPRIYLLVTALFALCAVLRLARFNAEHEKTDDAHDHFAGLPTPAAAGFVASLVVFMYGFGESELTRLVPGLGSLDVRTPIVWTLFVCSPLLAGLMVSRVRYTHGFRALLRRRKSFRALPLVLLALLLFFLEPELLVAIACVGYVAWGVCGELARRARGARGARDEDDEDGQLELDGDEEESGEEDRGEGEAAPRARPGGAPFQRLG
ncbi:MAG: phosphatidylcholine/phosphatidylserine synthase [Planctomycetes bacterium]|nr:phosphatidylcholine/phosphatidylserine synthase [Planctomycetota bacterium]